MRRRLENEGCAEMVPACAMPRKSQHERHAREKFSRRWARLPCSARRAAAAFICRNLSTGLSNSLVIAG